MKKSILFLLLLFIIKNSYSQNVGIGTNTPEFKLDVATGSINTSQEYKIQGLTILAKSGVSTLRIGHLAGSVGTDNTFCGYQAGHFAGGSDNSFFGSGTGYFNGAAVGNSFFGAFSGYLNAGNHNSFFGYNAGTNNTSGISNSFFGAGSGVTNTTASQNTGFGFNVLYNSNGIENTATGYKALFSNTTGRSNTATGNNTLVNNTSGKYNTAYGNGTLEFPSIGDDNSAFGANANACTGCSNTTLLGANTVAVASNHVRIGNIAVTSIGGYAGWSNLSDGRFKKNILHNVPGLDFIIKLKPITYTLDLHLVENFLFHSMSQYTNLANIEREKRRASTEEGINAKERIIYTGFIAQEVEESARGLGFNFSGVDAPQNDKDFYSLRYAEFVVPLVKAVQEQQNMIEKQEVIICKQQRTIENLLTRIENVEIRLQAKK